MRLAQGRSASTTAARRVLLLRPGRSHETTVPIGSRVPSQIRGINFTLIRLFRKHLGLTPYAYLTQVRVAKPRHLLRLGQPVAQVALDVGFADQAHFTKRFKQLTGTTPAFYAPSMQ